MSKWFLEMGLKSGGAARVRFVSRWMSVLCVVTSVVLAGGLFIYWLIMPTETIFKHAGLPGIPVWELGWGIRLVAIIISALPLGCLIWGLLQARLCFDAFADGDFFAAESARRLRAFAVAMLVSTLLKPLAGAALSVLLSFGGHPGRKTLVFSVSSDTLLVLIFAGLIAVMAGIMAQARSVAEENSQFV